jgi:ubiquinone/menaquinone biosynthesis C-methylase UbiE
MRRFARLQRKAVEKLDLAPGETVIDVACGTGLNFAAIEEGIGADGTIIGIDLSSEMLDVARGRVAGEGWTNVRLYESSIEEVELDEVADGALFSFTHDVLQSPDAVARVVAHLRPGGRVASVGAKLSGRWNVPVNFFVRRAALPYITTFRGLERPWSELERYAPRLEHKSLALGGAHLAWGEVSSEGVAKARNRSAPDGA